MIALDSSSLIAFLGGDRGADVDAVELAFEQRQGVLPPVVLSEMLSERRLPAQVRELLLQVPLLEVEAGYWSGSGCSGLSCSSAGGARRSLMRSSRNHVWITTPRS
ncbi:MAG: hypothetical protein ACREKJ_09975 [Candidatus Rokuibacteriota bacterium]